MAQSGESSNLISSISNNKKSKLPINWEKYGLSDEPQKDIPRNPRPLNLGDNGFQDDSQNVNELFAEDQSTTDAKPWWKANFFISGRVLFGTWDGVFTSCMINIFGVILFLRTGWVVANAGVGLSILIVLLSVLVAMTTVLSGIGICERCHVESGGVYFLISHVLGGRIGGAIGIVYCIGQAVASSLCLIGFGESMATLLKVKNEWVVRGIAIGVLLLLSAINFAGVKWVIKLQLALLMMLFLAAVDFTVGSFVHTDLELGVMGYQAEIFANNSGPSFQKGEDFFTIFGVFFPTVTGVLAGINMSGDLRHPSKNIPAGTLSALGVSTFLYLVIVLVLGATCTRKALFDDYMIAERVSITAVLWLSGLYISSLSSSLGALYGAPRILQCIAAEKVIPILHVLSKGRGPNKDPVLSLLVITLLTLAFVLVGKLNTLAPIATMPFLLTYAALDYAYFSLAMTFDIQQERDERYRTQGLVSPTFEVLYEGKYQNGGPHKTEGSVKSKTSYYSNDLDNLFPERVRHKQITRRQSSVTSTDGIEERSIADGREMNGNAGYEDTTPTVESQQAVSTDPTPDKSITRQPRSCYSVLCNRWISLGASMLCVVWTFPVDYRYALANLSVMLLIYIYIALANPGVSPGIAEFKLFAWLKSLFTWCCRRGSSKYERIVVTPMPPGVETLAAQLTEDSEDFASRGRYHQSSIINEDDFDDYE